MMRSARGSPSHPALSFIPEATNCNSQSQKSVYLGQYHPFSPPAFSRFAPDEHLFTQAAETGAIMLIKKADIKNHLAAKLRKHHMLQGSIVGQMPVEHSSTGNDSTVATASGSSQEPLNPSSEFVLPIRSSGGC
jgi:hypothetical protein